jgi:hypothetical protein
MCDANTVACGEGLRYMVHAHKGRFLIQRTIAFSFFVKGRVSKKRARGRGDVSDPQS